MKEKKSTKSMKNADDTLFFNPFKLIKSSGLKSDNSRLFLSGKILASSSLIPLQKPATLALARQNSILGRKEGAHCIRPAFWEDGAFQKVRRCRSADGV